MIIINCVIGFGLMLFNYLCSVFVMLDIFEKWLKRIVLKIIVIGVNILIIVDVIFVLIMEILVVKKIKWIINIIVVI